MGIKQFNCVPHLNFPNVIRPNESNFDSETSHFTEVVMLKNCICWNADLSFTMWVYWDIFWGPSSIMWHCNWTFGHYVRSASKPNAVSVGLPPWMYQRNWRQSWRQGPVHSYESCSRWPKQPLPAFTQWAQCAHGVCSLEASVSWDR